MEMTPYMIQREAEIAEENRLRAERMAAGTDTVADQVWVRNQAEKAAMATRRAQPSAPVAKPAPQGRPFAGHMADDTEGYGDWAEADPDPKASYTPRRGVCKGWDKAMGYRR